MNIEELIDLVLEPGSAGPPRALAHAERYAAAGLCLQWLCGATCTWQTHTKSGHPPEASGKIPLRGGWNKLGYRTFEELKGEYQAGCNLSVLTGWQSDAPLSVVVVDGDDADALAWMRANLPATPIRARTRRGEHWYYRCAGPTPKRNFIYSRLGLKIDLMGDGGQVVAPPSVHREGHEYAEIEPWTPAALASMPTFDPAWFAAATPNEGTSGTTRGPRPVTGSWPGSRKFSSADLAEAWERAITYLTSPNCPASVSGEGGDQTLYDVAVKLLRGWPLATPERRRQVEEAGPQPLDAADAQRAALELLRNVWNHRCTDGAGEPYPWSEDRLIYKIGEAAEADSLPGPDYWLFDNATHRARYAGAPYAPYAQKKETPESAATDAGGEESDPMRTETDYTYGNTGTAGVNAEQTASTEQTAKRASTPRSAFRERQAEAEAEECETTDDDGITRDREGKIKIEITHDTEQMKSAAIRVLGEMGEVYVSQRLLCDMVPGVGLDRHEQPERPTVRRTSKSYMKSRMNSAAHWFKIHKSKDAEIEVRERSDGETVAAVLAAGAWPGVRRLDGVIFTPIVRRDGTILQEPGYDPQTCVYYHAEVRHREIPARPTDEQVRAALAYLLEIVKDFRFSDGKTDPATYGRIARAAWLSAVLTRFCRYSYSGLAPMFAVNARQSGSGKTLLADCASIIADGRSVDIMKFTGDEDEATREILAVLGRHETHALCLDNLKIPLSSAAYEAMLTGSAQVGRVVGSSEIKRVVLSDAVWWANGNNLEVGIDMSRRCLLLSIADPATNPERPNLREWCREHRGNLVRACLVILAGFAAAGGPQAAMDCDGVPVTEFASFEDWGRVVRQAVIWCGLPDPVRAIAARDESVTTERAASNYLIRHWVTAFGTASMSMSDAIKEIKEKPSKCADLAALLAERGVKPNNAVSLGKYLKDAAKGIWTAPDGRRFGMVKGRDDRRGMTIWAAKEEAA